MPIDSPTRLAETVYGCLRAIANRQMRAERKEHTLTATALVHEAFLRLGDHAVVDGAKAGAAPEQRLAFLRAAAEAMRRILVEHARARNCIKRGGGQDAARRLNLDAIGDIADLASEAQAEAMIALDAAFVRLESMGGRFADVVRLRFYAGLSLDEIARTLGVSERSVDKDWAYARAFLARELKTAAPS